MWTENCQYLWTTLPCFIIADTDLMTVRPPVEKAQINLGPVLLYCFAWQIICGCTVQTCVFKCTVPSILVLEFFFGVFACRQRHVLPVFFNRQADISEGVYKRLNRGVVVSWPSSGIESERAPIFKVHHTWSVTLPELFNLWPSLECPWIDDSLGQAVMCSV